MIINGIFERLFRELSAGNFIQNLGFYTLIVLLAWILVVLFKLNTSKYKSVQKIDAER